MGIRTRREGQPAREGAVATRRLMAWRSACMLLRGEPAAATRAQRGVLAVLGAIFVLLALAQVAWAAAVLTFPAELNYGESIILDQTSRLLRGEPLYQSPATEPYTLAAYTPLYYVVVAALRGIGVGDGFFPGRVLSLASALGSAALIARLAVTRLGILAGA